MEDIPLFHEGSGIQIESFDAPSSLVRQNSVLLAELKQESLSRKDADIDFELAELEIKQAIARMKVKKRHLG